MKIGNLLLVVGAAFALVGVGCEEKSNPVSQAASQVSKAADSAAKTGGDIAKAGVDAAKEGAGKVAEAGKAAGETVAQAAEGAKDAVKEGAAAAGDALKKLQAEGTKWLNDTVTKEWPGLKTQLDDAAKKVANISDAGVKAKAEGLVNDLKGQVPKMEELVGKLTNFKEGDFGKLFDEAKKMWDGFGGKLKELTGMLPK